MATVRRPLHPPWDLARAIGAGDRLDGDLVAACANWFASNEDAYRAAGVIGPRPHLPADADRQTILLATFGWTTTPVAES